MPDGYLAERLYGLFASRGRRAGVSGAWRLVVGDSAERNRDVADGVVWLLAACCRNRVRFRDLGLVVVDEQQRFSVKDGSRLVESVCSDGVARLTLLMMTPIPRAAQVLCGDVEVISAG